MKKIHVLSVSLMILGLFHCSAGKLETAPCPFLDGLESRLGNRSAEGLWGLPPALEECNFQPCIAPGTTLLPA